MLHQFCIVHRRKPSTFEQAGFPVWATCLRSLAFVKSPSSVVAEAQDQVYVGAKAYQFLLEVVCGLHSPIVGETEVFGQFKLFTSEWLKLQPECAGLVQKILADGKFLRSKHLSHLGNQSYGSWLRKNLKADEVHVLGAGHLVQEILPYLNKQGKNVTLHVRNAKKADFYSGHIKEICKRGFTHGALVIAAPLTAAEIEKWLGDHQPAQIFDLRDNSNTDRLQRNCEKHGLKEIFNQIEENKSKLLPIIERVRTDIVACTEKLTAQAFLRPQGWDDLCA